jgi:hypothetical protein
MQSLADMVNGSISDPLAHPGQISSFGRLNGNPVSRANGFLGGGQVPEFRVKSAIIIEVDLVTSILSCF